jgi:hypothetical protein
MLIDVKFELTGTPAGVVGLGTVPCEIAGCCDSVRKSLLLDPVLQEGIGGLVQAPLPDPQLQTWTQR